MSISQLVRPNIRTLEPYHSARETIQEGILLDANENPFPQLWGGIQLNRYPDPNQIELRQVLAEYLHVGPENVIAGVGSDEVLDWVFKVFCQPGQDQVSVAEPTYGMYRVLAQIFGVKIFEVCLDESFDFSADLLLEQLSPEVKVIFLCSPNNPTGNLLDRDQVLQLCRSWQGIVVVDEAYIEFSESPSLVSELAGHPNLIVVRTLSKAFGRAGVRLGYAVAGAEIISLFLKVKAPYNLGVLAIKSGLEVLREAPSKRVEMQQIRAEKIRVAASLARLSDIERVYPSEANFLLFRCPQSQEVCRQLLGKGIVLRDRSSLPGLEDCIRVTIGTMTENNRFLNELEICLELSGARD